MEDVPPEARPIHELVISQQHRCARSRGGRITCWEGQRTVLEPALEGFTDLEFDHTARHTLCGARGHEVVCWSLVRPIATQIAVDAVAVAAAGHGFCALGHDGRVRCWQPQCEAPVEVVGLDNVVAIAGPCAARRDGPAVCWPADWCTSDSAAPVPQDVAGSGRLTALAADVLQVCGRTREGGLVCWGLRQEGGHASPPLRAIAGLAPVETFAVGYKHACANSRDGALACWGDNGDGQLGEPHNVPRLALPWPLISDAKELGLSISGGCVIRADDRVWCWGAREDGWDGAPRLLPEITDAHGLVMPESGGCVRRRSAAPMCWGFGQPPIAMPWPDSPQRPIVRLRLAGVSEIGCAVYEDSTAECVLGANLVPRRKLRGVRDVVFCGRSLCSISTAGAVHCVDRRDGESVPFPVETVDSDVEIRCSDHLACAVKPGVPARCWQYDAPPVVGVPSDDRQLLAGEVLRGSERAAALSWSGRQLCLRTSASVIECTNDASDPMPVHGARGAVQVEVEGGTACVRHHDGVVACWGENRRAAAGVGSSAPQERPVAVTLPDAVASVAPPA